MPRAIAIGAQGFADIREHGYFLVDKTGFVRDWWGSGDAVTLVCRPRRFGKTLNLSMVECFLSSRFAGRSDLFDGLEVWESPGMRAEQGAWPVVSLSFADVKAASYGEMRDAAAGEGGLEDALAAAHAQIEERRYADELDRAGVRANRIHTYGLAFDGKRVLVG